MPPAAADSGKRPVNPGTGKHSRRTPCTAVPSHQARSTFRSHPSPPATLHRWLGFGNRFGRLLSCHPPSLTCSEERPVDNLAAPRDQAAMELPPPPPLTSGELVHSSSLLWIVAHQEPLLFW